MTMRPCPDCGERFDRQAFGLSVTERGRLKVVCSECYDTHYSFLCGICEERVGQDRAHGSFPTDVFVMREPVESGDGYAPGIYLVVHKPFYNCAMLGPGSFSHATIARVADLPKTSHPLDDVCDCVCEECQTKYLGYIWTTPSLPRRRLRRAG